MFTRYWKITGIDGTAFATSPVEGDTHTIGRRLRKAFPMADGYSVRRVTIPTLREALREPDQTGQTTQAAYIARLRGDGE